MNNDHPYTKLKHDCEHLLGRTWDLFNYGISRERNLEGAVANAWKMCERLSSMDDLSQIKAMIEKYSEFFMETLNECNSERIDEGK